MPFITPNAFLTTKMQDELFGSKNCKLETPANTLLGNIIAGLQQQFFNW